MTAWLRRAGHVRSAEGSGTTWSVAEGRRGRRWRELVRVGQGRPGLRHSLLLETDAEGRFAHLELSTDAGLLTLHPEGDGTLHGNALEASGVRHLVGLPWDDDGVVDIEGSPVAAAAGVLRLTGELATGESAPRSVLRVTGGLLITTGPGTVERVEADAWRVSGGPVYRVDADGLPVLQDGEGWPLEQAE